MGKEEESETQKSITELKDVEETTDENNNKKEAITAAEKEATTPEG